jgi:hypothetical protein
MKKTVKLTHPKIKLDRLVDAAKHDIKKYLKRERNKPLPEGAIFWDFDCKFGNTEAEAVSVHLSELGKHIEEVAKQHAESCYIEIVAKPGKGMKAKRAD